MTLQSFSHLPRQVCIIGASSLIQSSTKPPLHPPNTTSLISVVMQKALCQSQLSLRDIDGIISVPSLAQGHFMEAHYQSSRLGLFRPGKRLRCRTIDTGGAGPITALLQGVQMIEDEGLDCVAIIAADCVGSMNSREFLKKADDIFFKLDPMVESPAIPFGYDKVTEYQMRRYGVTRDQLRMAVCLESFHAGMHKESLFHTKQSSEEQALHYTTIDEVRNAPQVTPNISLLECARRADGAACVILANNHFLKRKHLYRRGLPAIIGVGELSGPLYPQGPIDEDTFSCELAMEYAYAEAGHLTHEDIDFFGLYDCFPICLIRALEACGLCTKGKGGDYLELQYNKMMEAIRNGNEEELLNDASFFPVNTHGGLLCYGAPWEVPAMYNVVEAVHQLRGEAKGRQIQNCRRALVYGNGGVFSASAIAIMAKTI